RAARNVNGHVIMYADTMTDSMKSAIEETERRRSIQDAYNHEHGITPQSVKKEIRDLISISKSVDSKETRMEKDPESMSAEELTELIGKVQRQMKKAASDLDFETAAKLRDQMIELKKHLHEIEG
ncbi:MAG: UvrB/UvrC motif-containing protein, partial [Lachnospiraceae bacterium]|nr:UvrB/UvrC motif-containing protein [Lachnospiraceae bacterium]